MDSLMSFKDHMNNTDAITVDHLSKCYRIYSHPRDRLIQALWGRDRRGNKKLYYRPFWALKNVNFNLPKGQTLGIVGRNGSGKSTLLQLICGTLQPTSGIIQTQGRIGALLELGSGFNPEFSGLENIYLNASLLGLNRAEINEKLDAILSFADIGDFVKQPVKTYSSGMGVRLAFAVQAHIDPDILIVDEALAVGDELFQKKCYSHLERLKDNGTSILLVTHSSGQIMRHCDQALLLHRGESVCLDKPARIIVLYQRLLNSKNASIEELRLEQRLADAQALSADNTPGQYRQTKTNDNKGNAYNVAFYDEGLLPQSTEMYECKAGEILDAWVEISGQRRVNTLPFGTSFDIIFKYKADEKLANVAMSCFIANHTGQGIAGQTFPTGMGAHENSNIKSIEPGSIWTTRFHFNNRLWPGVYLISGALVEFSSGSKKFVHRAIDFRAIKVMDQTNIVELGACNLSEGEPEVKWLGKLDES